MVLGLTCFEGDLCQLPSRARDAHDAAHVAAGEKQCLEDQQGYRVPGGWAAGVSRVIHIPKFTLVQ